MEQLSVPTTRRDLLRTMERGRELRVGFPKGRGSEVTAKEKVAPRLGLGTEKLLAELG